MHGLETFFSAKDWATVAGYLGATALITWGAQRISRGADSASSVSWPVVAASLAASDLTAWLLLAVPGAMLAIHGDLAFLNWILVALLVRIVVGALLIRRGWSLKAAAEEGGAGALEPVILKIGERFRDLALLLTQGLRLVVLALPLLLLTPWRTEVCLLVVWLLAGILRITGGFRAVVRGEWIHLLVLVAMAGSAIYFFAENTGGSWDWAMDALRHSENFSGEERDKLAFPGDPSDPARHFTIWTALFCLPWWQFQSLTLDRASLRRMRLCATPRDAGLAVITSGIIVALVLLIFLVVGLALFLVYRQDPPTDPAILNALSWTAGDPGRVDLAVPIWVLTELPEGLRGLIFAAFFGAGLTGLHASLLATRPDSCGPLDGSTRWQRTGDILRYLALPLLAILMARHLEAGGEDLLAFGFSLATYTAGPLIGLSWLATRGADGVRPFRALLGAILSLFLACAMSWGNAGTFAIPWLDAPELSFAWLWPFTALATWLGGWKKRDLRTPQL